MQIESLAYRPFEDSGKTGEIRVWGDHGAKAGIPFQMA